MLSRVFSSSLRGANGLRERAPDDRLLDEAIQSFSIARNDDGLFEKFEISSCPSFAAS